MDCASSMSIGSKKSSKSRCIWSAQEDDVLVHALKDLVIKNWKTDNGFRVGYLNKLEDAMREVFPGSDIRAQPHINSKITTWKKYYDSLSTMLRRTGVNFNGTTFMIDCPNEELWEAVVREDGNAAAMRFKSWPYFEAWTEIFGKDHATGEGAEDFMDTVNELVLEDNLAHGSKKPVVGYPEFSLDDFLAAAQSDDGRSINQSDKQDSNVGKARGERKLKTGEETEKLVDIVDKMCAATSERFQDIARYIGYEYGLGESRKRVYELLSTIPDLTLDDKLDVAEKLASSAPLLEMFIGFPPEARVRYVGCLLGYGRPRSYT